MRIPDKLFWKIYVFIYAWAAIGGITALIYPQADAFIYYHLVITFHPDGAYHYWLAIAAALINIMCLAPIFGYAFNRTPRHLNSWRFLFFLRIAGELAGRRFDHLSYKSVIISEPVAGTAFVLLIISFALPAYIAHYRHVFRKT